jgi:hypothetical protein
MSRVNKTPTLNVFSPLQATEKLKAGFFELVTLPVVCVVLFVGTIQSGEVSTLAMKSLPLVV